MADGLDAWLLLNLTPGLGPVLMRRCAEALGSAAAVLDANAGMLATVPGIGLKRAGQIRRQLDEVAAGPALAQEKELLQATGARVLVLDDPGYPALLRHIPDPPPVLLLRGDLRADDAVALAVVGARRCSLYGRAQAERLTTLCSQAGLCIVSGGAYGIDAVAHEAALSCGGRTIAVLGSGLAKPYPPAHQRLFDRIADGHGAVLSELPLGFPPLAENFPRRNRIIAGLALGVFVVEAALHSGALITARLAAEEQGREVLALPGRVDSATSAGCHRMIREGWATLVTGAADILDALGETGQLLKAGLGPTEPGGGPDSADPLTRGLTATQQRLVEALAEPRSLDQLAAATGLAVPAIQADLTVLEIRGVIAKAGGQFCRRR